MNIVVKKNDGTARTLEALSGWRVMEIIRDHGLPIKAECGGACCCATCHVYVSPEWVDKLIPPNEEESALLEDMFGIEATSRLSCQILMSEALDGLTLTLAPGSEP